MKKKTQSDPNRRSWFWVVPSEEPDEIRPTDEKLREADDDTKLFIEKRDWVRIRVEEEKWNDAGPTGGRYHHGAGAAGGGGAAAGGGGAAGAGVGGGSGNAPVPPGGGGGGGGDGGAPAADTSEMKLHPPYALICSMAESGTGVLEWWAEEEEEEEEE